MGDTKKVKNMTNREILKHIDDGANYYVGLFGEAVHMEKVDKEFYSYVTSKAGEQGISFIYNVRINDLPAEQMKRVIDEMKSMNMPIWLDLLAPDEVIYLFSGKKPTQEKKAPSEDDEVYLAMLSEEKMEYPENDHKIIKVHTAEEFAIWAQLVNDILAGGHTDIHPVNHFVWCEKCGVKCYILYHDNVPVSVASIMDNNGAASLEFVGTVPEMRRKGFAKAICEKAVSDAFADGSSIITIRAINRAAARLYQSVGFKAY
ncbi:MAG: GNAT family N-acetyltransferase [Lachnospiraceae bacterium]|nr:GNAT family N-acetyltransferase [Lachnospiraceae bacterium]